MNSPVHVIFSRKWDTSLHFMLQSHTNPPPTPPLFALLTFSAVLLKMWKKVTSIVSLFLKKKKKTLKKCNLISFVSCRVIITVSAAGFATRLIFWYQELLVSLSCTERAGRQSTKKKKENGSPHRGTMQCSCWGCCVSESPQHCRRRRTNQF